ncbi:phosphopantetheine-binding protein [Paenibacillus zanthoxyli]|uniref:phosphopantetheine-binding protein n=1 Tax=Paenibacillus zanthoxyli TaxID=369399 RepID=UPI001E3CBAB2|nr:phosphopantetheine-binding protein [Paenibacillus zanthoxyli]
MQNEICEVLVDILKDENIIDKPFDGSYNSNLKEEYGMDSMNLIRYIVEIEEKFEIEFNDEQLLPECFATIYDISMLVVECLGTK